MLSPTGIFIVFVACNVLSIYGATWSAPTRTSRLQNKLTRSFFFRLTRIRPLYKN